MQSVMALTVVVAGLFFSFACALLLEELLFGGIFRLFFGKRAALRTQAIPQSLSTRRNRPRPEGGEERRNDNYYL